MTKPRTFGLPACYAEWLAHSCCLESLIGQQFADQLRQQPAAQMLWFHIMILLTKIFVPQVVAQTHSQNANLTYVADTPEVGRVGV